ncbi:MAG: hypothetical protein JRJ78_13885 [Deltaproteobacteria bacterium]|nr:hypothetical protein [Deltaproteobacteria bacterium]
MGDKPEETGTEKQTQEATVPDETYVDEPEQVDEMLDMLGDEEGTESETEASDKEQEGQPADETEAKDEEETSSRDDNKTSEEEGKEKDESETQTQDQEGLTDQQEEEYRVKLPDGTERDVPVKDLVTAYQQVANYQRLHQGIKPLLDVSQEYQLTPQQIMEFFSLGVQTAAEREQGHAGPQDQAAAGTQPQQYDGPFKDAEEEAYFKEADPAMYDLIMRQHQTVKQLQDQLRTVSDTTQSITSEREQALYRQRKERVEGVYKSLADRHPKLLGTPEGMQAFQQWIAMSHFARTPVDDVSVELLETALSQYNPEYYKRHLVDQALLEQKEREKQEQATFAETEDVRTGGDRGVQVDEQQKEMMDLLSA